MEKERQIIEKTGFNSCKHNNLDIKQVYVKNLKDLIPTAFTASNEKLRAHINCRQN